MSAYLGGPSGDAAEAQLVMQAAETARLLSDGAKNMLLHIARVNPLPNGDERWALQLSQRPIAGSTRTLLAPHRHCDSSVAGGQIVLQANALRKRPYARIEVALQTAIAAGDPVRAATFQAELDRREAQSRKPTPLTPMAPIPEVVPHNEVWLPVPYAPLADLYEVSSHGRIRRYGRKPLSIKPRGQQRYLTVTMFRPKADGGPVTWRLHRLVAGAFVANPDNLPEVNHKDCDRLNNHAANLEWVTRGENIAHSIDAGRNTARTNPNKVRKLTPEAVETIRREFVAGESFRGDTRNRGNARELAQRFGVSSCTIYRVIRGATQVAPHERGIKSAYVTRELDVAKSKVKSASGTLNTNGESK